MNARAPVLTGFWLIILLLLLFSAAIDGAVLAGTEKNKPGSWEELVLKGNEYRDRSRSSDAQRCYIAALKVIEKQGIDDIRKAIVLNNQADIYRIEDNRYRARLHEQHSALIYRREIEHHQLGYEYSSDQPVDFSSGSLRPLCYLCHENWKVVPLLYGPGTGYDGEVPSEDDAAFTHKPGGPVRGDQRWYCRDCHQAF
jgi:hypothetical protein